MTAPALPYATLLGFARYVDRTGPAKAAFVGGLRRRKESKSGFNPHGQLVKALKADIAFHGGGRHLTEAVDAVNPRWHRLYTALLPGALKYGGIRGLASLAGPGRTWIAGAPASPVAPWLPVPASVTLSTAPAAGSALADAALGR